MSNGRHSFVRFFPSDWAGGVLKDGLSDQDELLYFRICCQIWDTAKPLTRRQVDAIIARTTGGHTAFSNLIECGKLTILPDGMIVNSKAMSEAVRAYDVWLKKSVGGRTGRQKQLDAGRVENGESPGDSSMLDESRGDSLGDSPKDSREKRGVPRQNQNQNQNQISPDGESSAPSRATGDRKSRIAEKPISVSDEVWSDFLDLRKTKKAPVTETALNGIIREAEKAGWTIEQALIECCVRGWRGFNADWVKRSEDGKPSGWLAD